jgi:hypothetical protein
LLGDKFLKALIRNRNKFAQQYDAITGETSVSSRDGYGPTILAALEYVSRMHGIHLDVEKGQVWWSGLTNAGPDYSYTQRWDDRMWALHCTNGSFTGHLNGRELFSCTAGVRVVTDLAGELREVAGIDPEIRAVELRAGARRHKLTISPNQAFAATAAQLKLLRQTPFDPPARNAKTGGSGFVPASRP